MLVTAFILFYTSPHTWSRVFWWASLWVHQHISETTCPPLTVCNMLCNSGFVDDVVFQQWALLCRQCATTVYSKLKVTNQGAAQSWHYDVSSNWHSTGSTRQRVKSDIYNCIVLHVRTLSNTSLKPSIVAPFNSANKWWPLTVRQ